MCTETLTTVCTMYILRVLISLTNSKMLRSSLFFSLSIIASRVMKVPVRPTPALKGEMNTQRHTQNKLFKHTVHKYRQTLDCFSQSSNLIQCIVKRNKVSAAFVLLYRRRKMSAASIIKSNVKAYILYNT